MGQYCLLRGGRRGSEGAVDRVGFGLRGRDCRLCFRRGCGSLAFEVEYKAQDAELIVLRKCTWHFRR